MTQQSYYETYRHTAVVHEVGEDGLSLLNQLGIRPESSTRSQLGYWMGWSDRRLRKQIELLRRAGVPVISTSGDHPGYRLAKSVEEIEAFCESELNSRIKSLYSQLTALQRTSDLIRDGAMQEALL